MDASLRTPGCGLGVSGKRRLCVLPLAAVMLLALMVVAEAAHAATCTQANPVDRHYCEPGGGGSFLGQPTGDPYVVGSGRGRNYRGGVILWSAGTAAHEVHGAILARYRDLGTAGGVLGFPVTDELRAPDGVGRYNHFQRGSIYWTPGTGAHEVHGAIRGKWASMGWEGGPLGYPVTDEYRVTGGRESDFQRGFLHWDAAGHWVRVGLGTVLASGVTHRSYVDPTGPFALQVVTLDPAGRGTLDTALSQDQLPGVETTSSMAHRHQALIAVNGDYFVASGRPVHAYAEDGHLMQAPMLVENNVSDTGSGIGAAIGRPSPAMTVVHKRTGASRRLARLNDGAPAPGELTAFTPQAGTLERPPGNACAARVRPTNPPFTAADGAIAQAHTVTAVACGSAPLPEKGETVLATPLGGAGEGFVRSMLPGDTLTLSWSLGWPSITDSLGGNPLLVQKGQVPSGNVNGAGPYFGRNPRTGVGVTNDGVVFLVTVDGRQQGYSAGMSMREFANYFQGLRAAWALELDGGGSTTMVVNGSVTNRPSDGSERPVANALLVLAHPDTPPTLRSAQRAPSATTAPADLALAGSKESRDPASTGGWADNLRRRGVPLSPELAQAAEAFRRR